MCFGSYKLFYLRIPFSTINKAFIRPHLDYNDLICDKIFNESWHKKLYSIQYNAALAVTGAIWGINTVKFYQELDLESLQNRHTLRRSGLFYKIHKDQFPLHLFNFIPAKTPSNYPLINVKEIPLLKVKQRFLENSFFPATVTEWNDLGYSLPSMFSSKIFWSLFVLVLMKSLTFTTRMVWRF